MGGRLEDGSGPQRERVVEAPVIDLRPAYRATMLADGSAAVLRERPHCTPIIETECLTLSAAVRMAAALNGAARPAA